MHQVLLGSETLPPRETVLSAHSWSILILRGESLIPAVHLLRVAPPPPNQPTLKKAGTLQNCTDLAFDIRLKISS